MTGAGSLSALLAANPLDPDATNAVAFWDDPHISQGMLSAHLDPTTDAATHRPDQVRATLRWLTQKVLEGRGHLDVLDLGCGPGLYAQQLAAAGHMVTGIDISSRSLDYARSEARRAGLAIDYRCQSYLALDEEAAFDLVLLIFCDFGALTRADQIDLLARIMRALRPDGVLVFDAFGMDFPSHQRDHRTWTNHPVGGFWSPQPHLVLEESRHFPSQRVVARRIVVIPEDAEPVVHHLRDHYFDRTQLTEMLSESGYLAPRFDGTVIGSADVAPGGVLLVTAQAPVRRADPGTA
jgi:SAM-dependent methyltransferase